MMNTVIDTHSYRQARIWFALFCLMHLIFWLLAPTLLYHNPPTDSLEGIAWGNLWLWGYEKHPFLAPWLTAWATNMTGVVGWPIYLLSQLSVLICFWATWRLANKILSPWLALISVVLLEGINYYNLQATIFDPNILMLPLWALTILSFYNAVSLQKTRDWILTGIFAGLAMDSKYESVLLFIILFSVLLMSPEGRRSFNHSGFYLGIIIAFLVFLPNLYWLYQHHFDAVNYAIGELSTNKLAHLPKIVRPFYQSGIFLVEQIGNIIPALILYLPFYSATKDTSKITQFNLRFLLLLGLGPLALTILLCLTTDTHLVSRWSYPFFSVLGLLWLAWQKPVVTKYRLKIFAILVVAFNILLLLAMTFYFILLPIFTGKSKHSDSFPGENIALALTQQWHAYYHQPLPYIAGTHHVVVNIAAFSPDKPIAYFNWDPTQSPWINENNLRVKGAIFVFWLGDLNQLIPIEQRYPNLQHITIEDFNRATLAKVPPIKIWVAFLPPAGTLK